MIRKAVRSEVFVGRTRELAHLRECYSRAERGNGNLVMIVGASGIGKTRLLEEFLNKLAPEACWRTMAQCLEYVRSPYMPFRDALRGLFPVPKRAERRDVESGSVARVLTRWEELAGPQDAHLSQHDRQKLAEFRTVFNELQSLSRIRPVILVIEDFHWADIASTELLQFISRGIGTTRIFVVLTARSEPIDDAQQISKVTAILQRDGASCIDLGRLSEAEIRVCLQSAARSGEVLVETLQHIADLADGNPLYAEELLCTALSRQVSDLSQPSSLPMSLRASVIERLRDFDVTERNVIEQASVIGRTFDSALLGRLMNQSPELIHRALRKAKNLNLIVERDTDPVTFAFRHALIREIVYRDLLAAETLPWHEWIAEELEKVEPLPVAELAYHWAAAGNAAKAIHYNLRAADAAGSAFARTDAARFLKRAYHFYHNPSREAAELCERLALTCYLAGQSEEARRWTDLGIDQFEKLGLTARIPVLLTHLARIHFAINNAKESLQLANRALSVLEDTTTLEQEVTARLLVARYEVLLTHWEEGLGQVQIVEPLLDDVSGTARASFLDVRGMARANLGMIDAGLSDLEEAVAIASSLDDTEIQIVALNNLGFVNSWLGRSSESLRAYSRSLEIADGKGYIVQAGFNAFGLVRTLLRMGDLAEARKMIDTGIERALTPVTEVVLAEIGISLGLLLGDDALVRRSSAPGILEGVFASESSERIGAVASAFVDLAIARGKHDEARGILERGIGLIENAAQSWWMLCQVALYGREERFGEAEELLSQAASVPGHNISRAFLLLFRSYKAERSGSDGRTQALAAAAIFNECGWRIFEARSRESGSQQAEALELYRSAGAVSEVRRLEGLQPKRRARGRPNSALTPREAEVAALVSRGMSNRDVSKHLNISENTVGHHLESIFNRLDITSRVQLAALVGSGEVTLSQN
ncbi:MAG TPA: AAA family ATPase [Candidatus Baltobacteraceae bacterium]|jgi:DNA-binding CsgD family transcriptional regulator